MRISSKSNSEDRSSWLSHGRRGGLAGSGCGDFALTLERGSIRDGVICIGRGPCSDGPIPLYGSL